jgi:ubiquinone/menaquinone biosynthesis C-methylase UbiE
MPREVKGDLEEAVRIQRKYYADTASNYDTMHAHEGDGDPAILKLVTSLLHTVEPVTLLDVGSGTGRGVRQFATAMPELSVRGVEPVSALIEQAVRHKGMAPGSFIQASGEALPFGDASFDVVCSFALLHHVPRPSVVVREMLRVARKAVVIVDSNRFGQGRPAVRMVKLLLYKLRLWNAVNFVKTRGKGYLITEGDGLAYSYSVYDSFELVSAWANRVIMIPVDATTPKSWLHPLLTSGGVIVCALREIH